MVMLPGTENFIRVWNAFERLNINLEASTAGRDISRFLNHGMQPEVLMLAAEIAGNNAAKGWIYPLRILEGWDKKGILTLPQAQQEQAEHNAKRARREREKAARASGTRPADYYDPADYAKDDPDGTAWAEMFESLQAH